MEQGWANPYFNNVMLTLIAVSFLLSHVCFLINNYKFIFWSL